MSEGISEEANAALMNRYTDFFKMFIKQSENISRVTFWGVQDGNSWRNNWPVGGRTDYPLLFDRNYRAKPAVATIMKLAMED
ncbi:MAG TPA: hypothetical protein DEG09_12575 [Marinilabiliaceae bacterium]|nr:hypothetical protein [Marinilabiliaceae bacterium]